MKKQRRLGEPFPDTPEYLVVQKEMESQNDLAWELPIETIVNLWHARFGYEWVEHTHLDYFYMCVRNRLLESDLLEKHSYPRDLNKHVLDHLIKNYPEPMRSHFATIEVYRLKEKEKYEHS